MPLCVGNSPNSFCCRRHSRGFLDAKLHSACWFRLTLLISLTWLPRSTLLMAKSLESSLPHTLHAFLYYTKGPDPPILDPSLAPGRRFKPHAPSLGKVQWDWKGGLPQKRSKICPNPPELANFVFARGPGRSTMNFSSPTT